MRSDWKVVGGLGCFVCILLTIYYSGREYVDSDTQEIKEEGLARATSWMIGWIYFLAWSISFYPQLILNYQRKSTCGLSYNFVWLNLLGFVCYSVFNVAFFASERVREMYRRANDGDDNLVRANDVFFSIHAALVTGVTLFQMYFAGYQQPKGVLVWTSVKIFIALSIVLSAVYLILILAKGNPMYEKDSNDGNFFTMLSWLYFVSYIKLVISFVKYCPQVFLNYQLKSTKGWSLHNVILDFTGGLLSFLQLFIDASLEDDWDGLFGDPVKLGLSLLSLFFDIIFLVQHFVLYRDAKDRHDDHASEQDEDEINTLLTPVTSSASTT